MRRRHSTGKQRVKRSERGVTLIELMVTVGITAAVLIAVSGIFLGIQKQWAFSSARGKAVETAEAALDQIALDVNRAIGYHPTDGAKTSTFTLPANTDAQGNYVPARAGGRLQYVPGSRIRYYLSDATGTATAGTTLWRETNSLPSGNSGWQSDSAWSLVAGTGSKAKYNNVTAIAFSTAGQPSNVVQISVTVQAAQPGQTINVSLQRSVYLTNHN